LPSLASGRRRRALAPSRAHRVRPLDLTRSPQPPKNPETGRALAYVLARLGRRWRAEAAARMPEAKGDIREIVGQPVFVPLYKLFRTYGPVFRLSFGPKTFVVISDPQVARQLLLTNANKYSKGLLSEILDFVMGQGLIPADGEVWRTRRRAIVPALHKRYVASMVSMFGRAARLGGDHLAAADGSPVEMENFFSRLALDIIGKAVFNYEFESLKNDDPVIQAVYTALREAEYRSTAFIPYWNFPPARWIVPRQRKVTEALVTINATLDGLVAKCRALCEREGDVFSEEFLSEEDPSILHFLLASGEEISSKQLRDDLMTMLIAGHETTAAVLTWTLHLLADHPEAAARIRAEADAILGSECDPSKGHQPDGLGGRLPTVEDLRELKYTTRVINESMRLYPQPPVLIRRALEDDVVGGFPVTPGTDFFISVWNLHRSPALWDKPDEFIPERFGPVDSAPVPNEQTTDYAYLPFGGGKRKCVGDQFALFESVVALATLLRRFDFARPADAPPVGMTTGATIHTTQGLYLTATPRRDLGGGGGGGGEGAVPSARAAAAAVEGPAGAGVAEEQPAMRVVVAAEAAAAPGGGGAPSAAGASRCPFKFGGGAAAPA
jgi:beta-ring hydroxylase